MPDPAGSSTASGKESESEPEREKERGRDIELRPLLPEKTLGGHPPIVIALPPPLQTKVRDLCLESGQGTYFVRPSAK